MVFADWFDRLKYSMLVRILKCSHSIDVIRRNSRLTALFRKPLIVRVAFPCVTNVSLVIALYNFIFLKIVTDLLVGKDHEWWGNWKSGFTHSRTHTQSYTTRICTHIFIVPHTRIHTHTHSLSDTELYAPIYRHWHLQAYSFSHTCSHTHTKSSTFTHIFVLCHTHARAITHIHTE